MKKRFACVALYLVILFALLQIGAFAQEKARPLVMLTEYNPWAMVVGSDTPSFVLYDDGTLIYWGERDQAKQYLSVKLSGEETMSLLKSIKPDELAKLQATYEISEWTDQPTNVFRFWMPDPSGNKKISVYGSLRALDSRPPVLPESLWVALKLLRSYDNPKAAPWVPAYVEVMLWPFGYAKESVDWPAAWPGLNDPKTVKHSSLYSIYIESSHLEELKAFKARLKPKQAVKLSNKKWAMEIRFPFPHEIP